LQSSKMSKSHGRKPSKRKHLKCSVKYKSPWRVLNQTWKKLNLKTRHE